MHISYLYDIDLPSRFAAAVQILNTCRALCELGASVDLYVSHLAASEADCLAHYGLAQPPSLRLLQLPKDRQRRVHLMALRASLSAQKRGCRHMVISRGDSGIQLLPLLAGVGRPTGERHVYESHRLCFTDGLEDASTRPSGARYAVTWLRARRIRAREAATLKRADGVVCLTSAVRAAIESEFGLRCPTLILPSGTALHGGVLPGDSERDIDILYAGKLARRKGVFQLVEALRFLDRAAWIVGGTVDQVTDVRRAAQHAGVDERVITPGHVPPAQVRGLFLRARVGVCPLPVGESVVAERFSSPLKILDMMATGVPIVATDTPSVREILDERTSLLVPANDAQKLAAGIERLLTDRTTALNLASSARERVTAFSWHRRARRLLDFLGSLP